MITLCDISIGSFPTTQRFGENSENYKQFGLLGHNGYDSATPDGTILLNPFQSGHDVEVSFIGYDPSDPKGYDKTGYGNYIRIWDKTQQFVVLYAHCKKFEVVVGDKPFYQQALALSNNSGNSSGPHCHVGGYFVDVMGNKLNRDNGYDGCVDLLNPEIVTWQISNPTTPATAPVSIPTVTIPAETHERLVTNSDNFQRVIDIIKPGNDVNVTTSKELIDILEEKDNKLKTIQAIEDERNQLYIDKEQLKTENAILGAKIEAMSRPVIEPIIPVESAPITETDKVNIVERFFKYLFSLK